MRFRRGAAAALGQQEPRRQRCARAAPPAPLPAVTHRVEPALLAVVALVGVGAEEVALSLRAFRRVLRPRRCARKAPQHRSAGQ